MVLGKLTETFELKKLRSNKTQRSRASAPIQSERLSDRVHAMKLCLRQLSFQDNFISLFRFVNLIYSHKFKDLVTNSHPVASSDQVVFSSTGNYYGSPKNYHCLGVSQSIGQTEEFCTWNVLLFLPVRGMKLSVFIVFLYSWHSATHQHVSTNMSR